METTKTREYKPTPEQKRMFEQHFDETHSNRWNSEKIIKLEKLSMSPHHLRHILAAGRAEKSQVKRPEDIAKAFDLGNREVEIMVPESWYEQTPTFEIPRGYNNMLIVNDIHIPFHDVKALKTALEFGIMDSLTSKTSPAGCLKYTTKRLLMEGYYEKVIFGITCFILFR